MHLRNCGAGFTYRLAEDAHAMIAPFLKNKRVWLWVRCDTGKDRVTITCLEEQEIEVGDGTLWKRTNVFKSRKGFGFDMEWKSRAIRDF